MRVQSIPECCTAGVYLLPAERTTAKTFFYIPNEKVIQQSKA